jgi:predicted PurR-regulated permease PerM
MTDEAARAQAPQGTRLERAATLSLRFLLVVAALVVLGLIFERLRIVFVPLLLALLIAVALVPPRRRLERAGLPRRAASALVFVLALAVVAGVIAFVVPRLVDEFRTLDSAVIDGLNEVRDWLVDGPLALSPQAVDDVVDHIVGVAEANVGLLATGATAVIQVFTGLIVALVLAVFFVSGGDRMWSWSVRMFRSEHRETLDAAGRRAWRVLTRYLAGATIDGAVESTIVGLALAIIGVPLVLPLMALTFAAAFFPLIGAIVAGIVVFLVALVSEGWVAALVMGGVFIAVQQLEGNVLAPLVLGRAVRLHPVVLLVVLLTGASLGGILGAFIAVPLTAVTWGVIKELIDRGVIESPDDTRALLRGRDAGGITQGPLEDHPGAEG